MTSGWIVVERYNVTFREPAPLLTHETIREQYRGFDGVLWPADVESLELVNGLMPSEDFAVHRVAIRLAAGGHGVPEPDIRRRFHRGLALFHQVYKPLVDEWYHWRSEDGGLVLGDYAER